jgi:(p)ppGpp synthase/HD superfamily hydrolase
MMNRDRPLDIAWITDQLKRVTRAWSPSDRTRLSQAIVLARTKHAGQQYAPASEYAIHPLRAALSLAELGGVEPDVIFAALLHDTLEDTETTETELRTSFGDRVATLVHLMTLPFAPNSTVEEKVRIKQEHLAEIQRGPIEVRLIKCADLLDQMRNWRRLPTDSPHRPKLLRFLEEAQSYALPLAEATHPTFAAAMRRELQWFSVHAV